MTETEIRFEAAYIRDMLDGAIGVVELPGRINQLIGGMNDKFAELNDMTPQWLTHQAIEPSEDQHLTTLKMEECGGDQLTYFTSFRTLIISSSGHIKVGKHQFQVNADEDFKKQMVTLIPNSIQSPLITGSDKSDRFFKTLNFEAQSITFPNGAS